MIDFSKIMDETKIQLKGMLNGDSSQEQIKLISDLDKKLDNLSQAFAEKTKENESLKNDVIEMVKNTGFKVNNSDHDDSGIDPNPKSMDEIMMEELDKTIAKRNS